MTAPQGEFIDLAWLLKQGSLQLTPIVPAHGKFRFIHPSELPNPSPYVARDSVVLTLGTAFENNPQAFSGYVRRLAAGGVIAIGFNIGFAFESTPQELIDAAIDQGIGLFEVPYDISFTDILNAVSAELVRREAQRQEKMNRIYEQLVKAALSRGIMGLLETTAEHIDGFIAVVDQDDRTLAEAGTPHTPTASPVRHRLLASGQQTHWLVTEKETPLNPTEKHIVRHCVNLASIVMQRPKALREAYTGLYSMALSVQLGLDQDTGFLDSVFSQIEDSSGKVRAVVIQNPQPATLLKAVSTVGANMAAADRSLCWLRIAEDAALILTRGSRQVQDIVELCQPLSTKLRIAVSAPLSWRELHPERLHSLLLSARSLPLGHHCGPTDRTLQWTADPLVVSALKERYAVTIGRLEEHDNKHSTQLVDALTAYLQRHGNLSAAADSLHIHRQTLAARLDAIEQVSELSLDSAATRAELLVLLLARDHVHSENKPG